MMESAQYRRAANDVAGGDTMTAPIYRRGMRERHWYPRSQAHVRPAVVEMLDPRFQGEFQVSLVQRYQEVQAFTA